MLFDLKGKRRRTVQATYLLLAVLMGAGLVLFGIGSSVNGGLGDLFSGGSGSNTADEQIQKKIDSAEKRLQVNPRDQVALANVVRGHYQLATAKADASTGEFTGDSRPELQQAATAWQRYTDAVKKPDTGLARTALQVYEGLARLTAADQDPQAKTDAAKYWAGAAGAAEAIATAQPTPQAYLTLVQYASAAGQTRKADLAGNKAVEVAPKKQKKAVKQEVASAKAQGAQLANPGQQGAQGATPAPAPAP